VHGCLTADPSTHHLLLLLPLLQSQQTLDSFLTMRQRFAKIKSKRLQKVGGWVGGGEAAGSGVGSGGDRGVGCTH
jgi:hypothetical protein